MRTWRLALSLIGAAAIGGVTALLLSPRGESTPEQGREKELAARIEALEATETKAASRIVNLEQQARSLPRGPAAADTGEAEREPEPPQAAPKPAERGKSRHERAAAYERKFAAEPLDPTWARDAQAEYRAAIDEHLPSTSRILSFECRSDSCRLDVVHASIESNNEFVTSLFGMDRACALCKAADGFHAVNTSDATDQDLRMTVYIHRARATASNDPQPR